MDHELVAGGLDEPHLDERFERLESPALVGSVDLADHVARHATVGELLLAVAQQPEEQVYASRRRIALESNELRMVEKAVVEL
jgi:hypothetical protein